jgi:potassium-transporting ATPase KdpC subunit
MFNQLMPALRAVLFLTVLTGCIYPGIVTALCQTVFKSQADGSLIVQHGQVIGSALLGQNFAKPEYFHPRPSAAGSDGYDASASSGSNYGATNAKLNERVKAAVQQFRTENPTFTGPIPADALTTSGSGLDPQISVANATAQAARVAKARNLDTASVTRLIASHTEERDLRFLGEPRVNVLLLNLDLDRSAAHR